MSSVTEPEARTRLRGVVARGDHTDLVVMLGPRPWLEDALQLIGDGLLAAVRDGAPGSGELARECADALIVRRWAGDHDLADALEAALGGAPVPMLRPLAVDLEELAMILEGDPVHGGGRIDRRTGEAWPQGAIEYAAEVGELDEDDDDDTNRWLWVHSEGSRDGYQDMVGFIEDLDNPPVADRLARAISGSGAFRRFRNQLSEYPDLLIRWYAFSEDRHRGRARAWLAVNGYTPVRPPGRGSWTDH